MTSIKSDALAIGTVASGAAAYSVLEQNEKALKSVFVDPVVSNAKKLKNAATSKDTYVNAKKAAGKAFKAETYKNLKDNVINGAKKLKTKGTYTKAFNSVKTKTVNAAKATGSFVKSFVTNINWAKVGKTAGIAATIAAATLAVKAVYDNVTEK